MNFDYTESQTCELKRVWKDEYLKTLCAFANGDGGMLVVGVDDSGAVVGLPDVKDLLDVVPNKIHNRLGVLGDVHVRSHNGKEILEIAVRKTYAPVSVGGKFYKRSGSMTVALNGAELSRFLLNKYGKTWDDIAVEEFSLEEISRESVDRFKQLAVDRVPNIGQENDLKVLLEKLGLYDGAILKRAAILLFAKNPQKYFIQSHSKIGRFLSETDIQTSDLVEGNLFDQVERILEILRVKYLKAEIHFEGVHRREILEYPYKALREAVINALVHRDYTNNSNLQIKVYDNKLVMHNGAVLPEGFSVDSFSVPHPSLPHNPLIASVFYKAGLIENWGRGTIDMKEVCLAQGLPVPVFEYEYSILKVSFSKPSGEGRKGDGEGLSSPPKRGNEGANEGVNEGVNEGASRLLFLIVELPGRRAPFYAEKLKTSSKNVERWLAQLKKANQIEFRGASKTGGYWEISS